MTLHHFTTTDGLKLAYRDEGTGTPVICLAGLTRNMADFQPIADTYASRARIIRLDTRGRGLSDFDPDYDNYTVAQEAHDVVGLLDHLNLEQAAFIGTSRGGLITMAMAAFAKHRLGGVLLNDIGPVLEEEGLQAINNFVGRAPDYANYEVAADALAETMAQGFPGVTRATWRIHAERLWIEGTDGLELRYDPNLRIPVLASLDLEPRPDLWPFFDALSGVPMAMLRGEHSSLLSEDTFAEMQRRRPDAQAAVVPNRAHVPFLDEPVSAQVISQFLDRMP